MGTCQSVGEGDEEGAKKNTQITKILRDDKVARSKTIQILLLGAGESGKSTFLKQMRILFMDGIPKKEIPVYRDLIYSNIIVAIYTLTKAAKELGYSLSSENQPHAAYFSELAAGSEIIFDEKLGKAVEALWADPSIQKAFSESHRFQLSDSTKYFMEKLSTISNPDYAPSTEDILHSRSRTTGIVELLFDANNAHFKMIDVGGQRSERSKWIYCFEDVTAIIYFVALSEYNLSLQEDSSVNRLTESLKIFHQIVNAKWLVIV